MRRGGSRSAGGRRGCRCGGRLSDAAFVTLPNFTNTPALSTITRLPQAALLAINVTVDSVAFTNITLLAVEEVLPSEGDHAETLGRSPPPPRRRALAQMTNTPHPEDKPHVHLTFRIVVDAGHKDALAESELKEGISSGALARNMRARGVPADSVAARSLSRMAVTGPLPEQVAAAGARGGGGASLPPGAVAGIVAAGAALAAVAAGVAGYVARVHATGSKGSGADGKGKRDAANAVAAPTHAASPFDVVLPVARPYTLPHSLPPRAASPAAAVTPPLVGKGSAHGWPLLGASTHSPSLTKDSTASMSSKAEGSGHGGGGTALGDIPFSALRLMTPIGEGSFGRVHLARWGETAVAVKLLTSRFRGAGCAAGEPCGTDADAARALLAALRREAAISASLRHPNVVQFLGTVASPPAVVCEYCRHGSLADALARARAAVDATACPPSLPPADPDSASVAATLTGWPARLAVALGAAKGVLHLHTRSPSIVHRDLKAANVLLGAGLVAKVADFNLARAVAVSTGGAAASAPSGGSSLGAALNPRWAAPEVLSGAAPPPPRPTCTRLACCCGSWRRGRRRGRGRGTGASRWACASVASGRPCRRAASPAARVARPPTRTVTWPSCTRAGRKRRPTAPTLRPSSRACARWRQRRSTRARRRPPRAREVHQCPPPPLHSPPSTVNHAIAFEFSFIVWSVFSFTFLIEVPPTVDRNRSAARKWVGRCAGLHAPPPFCWRCAFLSN